MSRFNQNAGIAGMLVLLAAQGPVFAGSQTMKDLAPTKQDHAAVQARMNEQSMQRIYNEQQAAKRVKSEAERQTDAIPKSTTIRPTFDPPGVKVTIPTK